MSAAPRQQLAPTLTLAPLQAAGGVVTWAAGLIHQLHTAYATVVAALKDVGEHGECRLVFESATHLRLDPYNGNRLTVADRVYLLPAEGLRVSTAGLVALTTYYIYAYPLPDGETLVLEAATTGYVVGPRGRRVKFGDPTRTLVGLARTFTAGEWIDTPAQRRVLSWFNQRPRAASAALSANRTTTSASYVEMSTEIQVRFLVWAGQAVTAQWHGVANSSSAANFFDLTLGLDGTTPMDTWTGEATLTAAVPVSLGVSSEALTEGLHFITLLGRISGGATLTVFSGATAGLRAALHVEFHG